MTLSTAAITIGFIAIAIASLRAIIEQVGREIVPFSEGSDQ